MPQHEGVRKIGHRFRAAVKSTVADDRADPVIQVEYRREAEVHAHGAQLGRHQPPRGVRQVARARRIEIVEPSQFSHGGQAREAGTEPLHAPTLMIDGNQ